jgi:hypothetical protein
MNRYRRSSVFNGKMFAVIGIIAVFLVGGLLYSCTITLKTGTDTITVVDKGRVCDGQNDCKYLIYTDSTTFKVTDSLLDGNFSSSDVYGRIKRCHSYDIEWRGTRIPMLSEYQNITAVVHDNGRVDGCEPS